MDEISRGVLFFRPLLRIEGRYDDGRNRNVSVPESFDTEQGMIQRSEPGSRHQNRRKTEPLDEVDHHEALLDWHHEPPCPFDQRQVESLRHGTDMLFEVEEFKGFAAGQERVPPGLFDRIFR